MKSLTLWTIGHSNIPAEEFTGLLTGADIQTLVDVRRVPGSRKYPHFNSDALAASLPDSGIAYIHLPELGGRRKVQPDSVNTAWRNASFQAYADHMGSEEFADGIAKLLKAGAGSRTAFMCSEALWWRCHRSLIADRLKADGHTVLHLMGGGKIQEHPYTSPARLVDGELSYRA